MATSSFGCKFYVGKENRDEFIKTVTAPPVKGTRKNFQSKRISGEEARNYLNKYLNKK